MKIVSIETFKVTLPFRFSFAHSLASRASSTNIIVKVTLDDGTVGFGEGIPRKYVTGEDVDSAIAEIERVFAPALVKLEASNCFQILEKLKQAFLSFELQRKASGAAWCALELAILDAVSRSHGLAIADWFGPARTARLRYGAVVPLAGRKSLTAILLFYKLYGFKTIKVKVGGPIEEDLARLKLVRKIAGHKVTLRVDANCAWSVDQALYAAERFEPFNIASIEQPLAADDYMGLAKLTRQVEADIVVDESLRTFEEARMLIAEKACNAFNIRVSKVGGILVSLEMSRMARNAGIQCHLGAQVGESGIISSAARIVGCIDNGFENYEGCDNMFLLQKDLTRQNLTVAPGGFGQLLEGPGLGVDVIESRLTEMGTPVTPEPALAGGLHR